MSKKSYLPTIFSAAVFDTAYYAGMPQHATLYPVPMEWYSKHGVRKYGFHGTRYKHRLSGTRYRKQELDIMDSRESGSVRVEKARLAI